MAKPKSITYTEYQKRRAKQQTKKDKTILVTVIMFEIKQ